MKLRDFENLQQSLFSASKTLSPFHKATRSHMRELEKAIYPMNMALGSHIRALDEVAASARAIGVYPMRDWAKTMTPVSITVSQIRNMEKSLLSNCMPTIFENQEFLKSQKNLFSAYETEISKMQVNLQKTFPYNFADLRLFENNRYLKTNKIFANTHLEDREHHTPLPTIELGQISGGQLSPRNESPLSKRDFEQINLDLEKINIDQQRLLIIQQCIREVSETLPISPASAITLCASILEDLLLIMVRRHPQLLNEKGKKLNLEVLINVAYQTDLLSRGVKEYCDLLRTHRNHIHIDKQIKTGFCPDIHTANICCRILQTAIAQIAEKQEQLNYLYPPQKNIQ